MGATVLLAVLVASSLRQAPQTPAAPAQEGQFHAEVRREWERAGGACNAFSAAGAMGCAIELATDNPFHVAVGSLAPQNGLGMGGAFVYEVPKPAVDTSLNIDAVRSIDGAWRAGAYLTLVRTNVQPGTLAGPTSKVSSGIHPYPVFGLYAQTTATPNLLFLGEPGDGRGSSAWGMRETVVGGNALVPIVASGGAALAVYGEVDGRFVALETSTFNNEPTIGSVYDPLSAPGLATQPGTVEFTEGLRAAPSLWHDQLRLTYSIALQEFVASSDSTDSFRRLRVDLDHDIPWRGTAPGAPVPGNGPDQCSAGSSTDTCPAGSTNQYGTIHLGVRLIKSFAGASGTVPFYFQPTLGGTDIDGTPGLAAFGDYSLRGPDLVFFQVSAEHSLWWAVGGLVEAGAGNVGGPTAPLRLSHLHDSIGAGVTLRAGGFPMLIAEYAWSAETGHRVVVTLNTSLLGGGSRPSSF
jgi:hypothetical protein